MFTFSLKGQQKNLPLNHELNYRIQRIMIVDDTIAHSSLRPYVESSAGIKDVNKVMIDSALYYYAITQKLCKENLLELKGEDYRLTLDPLGNFRWGKDLNQDFRIMTRNTRALRVQGDLGSNFSFESFFYENLKIPEKNLQFSTF